MLTLMFIAGCRNDDRMSMLVNPQYANQSKKFANLTSFKEKGLPFVPYDEIENVDGAQHSFLLANYDDKGRLVELSSFVENDLVFLQKIIYSGDALKEVIKYNNAGKVTRRRVYQKGDPDASLK